MRALAFAAVLALAATAQAQTVEELQRQLKERDARILELTDALEGKSSPEDEELSRALERTLVQQGAMVLPAGTFELEPQFSYAHWDADRGPFRDEWDAALAFRAGFGRGWQFQAAVPYVHLSTATDSASGIGDASFSIAKQLRYEDGRWPAILASVTWLANTGKDGFDGSVPTGGGFNVLQGALTATKRADPLVYFGGISYSAPQSREISGIQVEPGDAVGLRGGAVLAATPHTSVNAGLNLGFVGASRVGGERVSDSDTVLGTFELGFGAVLGRRVMLNFSGQFRVSGPVPNFRLVLAVPIRF